MRLRDKTLEELEDLEQELHDQEDEQGALNYYQKITLYKEMHRRLQALVRQNKDEYEYSFEYVKRKLIFNLIHYGTYLKMEYQKEDQSAITSLKDALSYDRTNPIAAYRLGFLFYKQEKYSEALKYFQRSLDNLQIHNQPPYQLTNHQQLNAHMYLINSALHIAKEAYGEMNQLPAGEYKAIPNHDFSSLFTSLLENEQYLERHAFYKVSADGKTTCSKEECDHLADRPPDDTIILYYSDRDIRACFNEEDVCLSLDQAKILQHFLLNSSKARPASRIAFMASKTISLATYRKYVSRLREKLISNGFPSIIETTRYQDETAYFYNGKYPFCILYRVDEAE